LLLFGNFGDGNWRQA